MTLMNGFTSAAFRSLRRLPLGGAVRGEQGDADAVGVEDDAQCPLARRSARTSAIAASMSALTSSSEIPRLRISSRTGQSTHTRREGPVSPSLVQLSEPV